MRADPSPRVGRRPAARTCGPCTACCDGWLQIEVEGHHVDREHPCPFSTGHDCAIYARRPDDPCRRFICGWLAERSPLPEWMRPDRAGLILLAGNFIWQGRPVDVAVGPQPKSKALAWLKEFSAARLRPLLYQHDQEWYAFGPPAFQQEMHARLSRGERPWT